MNWRTYLLALLILHISCNTLVSVPSSTLTLVSSVPYTFNYTYTSRTIAASTTVVLSFSLNFNINTPSVTNCMFATTTSTSYTGTTCTVTTNSSGNYISFASIFTSELTSETLLSLKLQMPNPWGAGTQNINIAYLSSSSITQSQTVTLTYTASSLTSCQWTSSSTVNGASSSRTISFIPSVQLIQSSFLQVTVPFWFKTTSNLIGSSISCSSGSNVDNTPTCSYTTVGTNEVFTFSNLFSANKTVTTAVSLTMSNLYNPWSLSPFSPISYQLYNTQNGATRITQSCSGLSHTTTTLNSLSLLSSTASFTTISGVSSSKVIQFTGRNPVPATGGQVRISWAGGVTVTYTKPSNIVLVSQTSSQIIISNFSTIDTLAGTTRFLFGWSFVNPPSTRSFTITLTTLFSSGGTTYGIDTLTNTYNCNSGSIVTSSLTAGTYIINKVTTYTISFTTINALTSGSYIAIVFPTYIGLVSGSTCSSTNGLLSCSVSNTSYANISVSGTLAANTALSFTFNSVTNPNQALTTSSFLIYTYYDSGLDSLVDRLISGMTFTSVANQLTSDVYVVPSSLVTYASTSYLFSLQLLDKILSGGYFYISFPSTITLGSISLTNPSFPSSSCIISPSGNVVNITSCFSSDYSSLAITFTLTGVINPKSMQPSSSFAISTYGPEGQINKISSGLTVTMTTAATSTAFSISPSILTVNSYAVYTASVTFAVPHVSGDYILLTIPSSMQFAATPSCSATSGIALVGCSVYNITTLKVSMNSIPSTTNSFTITNIRNYDISSTSISFQLYTYNSANYLMEITPSASITYTVASITTYAVASNNQIVLNQASNITITFTPPFAIHSSFSSALTSIEISIPAEFSSIANSSCTSSVGSCSINNSTSFIVASPGISLTNVVLQFINIKLPYLSGASTSFTIQYLYNSLQVAWINSGVTVSAFCVSPCQQCTTSTLCLSCLPSPNNFTLYLSLNSSCVSTCPSGYYSNVNSCSACLSPCSTCSSATLCLTCVNGTTFYPSNSSCLSSCPTGYYNSSNNCSACISPCSTCTSSSSCLSCVATTYLTNSTCVNSSACPSGTYANTTTLSCDACQSPCATCDQSQSNCSTCISSYVYYNSTCLSSCPATMYVNSSTCVSCISPCYNCSSASFCLSCISTYLYNGSCYSSSLCPSGTFANTTSFTCDSCAVSCSTCQVIASNCTSCRSPYFNYNGSCVNTCPDGLFVNGTFCQSCVSPCMTCSSTTTCLSCSVNYYTNNSCVIASLCPTGTFANTTSLNCDSCSNNCTSCSSSSYNCTTCTSPYQYYNNTCITSCPSGMFASSNVCQTCISPCLTCNSSTSCLSCSSNFYTNYSCVNASQCPTGTFGNTTTLQCEACTSNCTTCFSSSSNCTACTSPYVYYNFQCISSCPNGTFQNSTACTTCSTPCNQCTSATLCTSCVSNYFYYNQTCVSSTLCPNGTYADTTNLNCSACSSPCITCSNTNTNCTSCISTLLYYSNQCLSVCPYQFYNSSGTCTACVLPCGNCSSASTCLSCITGFLTGGTCVNSSSCPNGTYAQSSNNSCTTCISPCTICSTTTNCTACSSPYSYYSFACTSTCPNGTYSLSSICQNCSSTCLTCSSSSSTCTSCDSSLNLYNSTCISGCPPGTYNSSSSCVNCSSICSTCSSFSTCTACTGLLYLTNSTCLSTCPSGTYADSSTNICQTCSSSCLTCSLSQSNCTTCPSNLLYYSYTCSSTCPTNYFNQSGTCTTCPNCASCTSLTVCFICNTGLYLYEGVCYSSCPPVAPIPNTVTLTCSLCGSSCSTCNADGTYCFTCSTGYLMLTGKCYLTCPSGYEADKTNTKCSAIKPETVVYYPFTISLFCISLIAIFSKVKYPHSDLIGNTTAFSALSFLLSIVVFTFRTYSTNTASARLLSTMDSNSLSLLLGLGIVVISFLFIIGVFFNIYIYRKFQKDSGLTLWKKNSSVNKFMYGLICCLSCFHFAIFRFIYSKIFLRECFSCYIKAHKQLIFLTNLLTFIVILFANAPSIALSVYILMQQDVSTQTQILALDNLIISSFLGILLLLDMGSRGPQDFQVILEDFPYLKRSKKYQDLDSSSGSLISIVANEEQKHYKTEVDHKETGKLKGINMQDKLGNFGVISHLQEIQSNKTITKTLPQFKNLTGQIDFNPYQLKRQSDDLFFKEKEYTKKFNELKETFKGATIFQQFVDDDGLTHNNQDLKQHNVQQIINKKKREIDPQQYLQRFRSEDYDNISPQQLQALMQMAEEKGLDPTFMKQTFGKNKYFNKKILEQLIGDHEQVSKESAQALLNDQNSETKLRQVLGNKSTINTDKLIDILNDQNYKEIIEAMFNKQSGFLSIDAIKDLLADNNKYSKDFIINLLNNKNIDKKKLQALIDSNKEGELDALQILKQLGGDDLQRKERMKNMLGKESLLNPTVIPKIKKEMSQQSTSNIFDNKSPANDTVIKKVINNKRIKLDQLNPIQQIPELIEQFAQLLGGGNQDIQEDLIQMLENDNYDGQKLKELVINSGKSQQAMTKFLQYIKQNKEGKQFQQIKDAKEEQPLEEWMQDVDRESQQHSQDQSEEQSLPSLNFSLNEDQQKQQKSKIVNNTTFNINTPINQNIDDSGIQSKLRGRTRLRKKEPKPIHLPSQEIYLQRLQAPHQVQRNKKFRKAKKKVMAKANKFMDQDNEVYDLDF